MEHKTIKEKLIAIQGALKAPKGQFNNFGKYRYRSCEDILEAVKPLCVANDVLLTISDRIELVGDRYYLVAIITLSDNTDKISCMAYARESESKKGMDDAQVTGAASSYARKYALNGMFCIDDNKDADTRDNRTISADETNQVEKALKEKLNDEAKWGELTGGKKFSALPKEKQKEIYKQVMDITKEK